MPPAARPLKQRLLEAADTSGPYCWEWRLSVDSGGYGQLRVGKKNLRAHRLSYEFFNGPIPDGMVVMHACDNRRCIRPDHLALGTRADNLADCRAKGRWTNRPREKSETSRRRGPVPKLTGERLWPKVAIGKPDECWEFQGLRHPSGYGLMTMPGTNAKARTHRVAYELTHGPIPPGLFVLHSCDNRACCNPDHLRVGTHADNNRDRAERKRGREHRQEGEANPNARLTDADVAEVFRLRAAGLTQVQIAEAVGIKQPQVSRILNGRQRRKA